MTAKGKIALMGSGELTPSMVEVHKYLLREHGRIPKAFFLDTPAGFQPNADDISVKAQEYFAKSVQANLAVASFKNSLGVDQYELKQLELMIEDADYLLIGPGSPTYTVRQLGNTKIPQAIARMVTKGGALAIASAAALTAGTHTLPVYELYKVGEELFWAESIDLLESFGIKIVVIPHFNNGEGGSHDTRFCYMGEQRYKRLQQLLPEETLYLGIDEHTACIIDFTAGSVEIKGQGSVTLQQVDREVRYEKGQSFSLQLLHNGLAEVTSQPVSDDRGEEKEPPFTQQPQVSFWPSIHKLESSCQIAVENRDFTKAIGLLLEFDTTLAKAADSCTAQEDLCQARDRYRELIVLLGVSLEQMQQKTTDHLEPLIQNLLLLRSRYKDKQQWDVADTIRETFARAGISITDSKDNSHYSFITKSQT